MKTDTFTRCRNHCLHHSPRFVSTQQSREAHLSSAEERSFLQLTVSIHGRHSWASGHRTAEEEAPQARKKKAQAAEGATRWSCHNLCFPHACWDVMWHAWRQTFQSCGGAQLSLFNIQMIHVYTYIYKDIYTHFTWPALHAPHVFWNCINKSRSHQLIVLHCTYRLLLIQQAMKKKNKYRWYKHCIVQNRSAVKMQHLFSSVC